MTATDTGSPAVGEEPIEYDSLYIDGEWTAPTTIARIRVHSANSEEYLGSVPEASESDIDRAVDAARRAFDVADGWSRWDPERRASLLNGFANSLETRATETARRVSVQNGMPITIADRIEGAGPAGQLRYYAEYIRTHPAEEHRAGAFAGPGAIVLRAPVGVVGAIVPWNVPQSITFMKLAPALAAGCTVVLKPSPETVLDAMLMAEAARAAGIPDGVLNVVPGGREVGAHLVSHPGVDKVSFTGSTAAGRAVAEICGRLLRPVTLELGGKSAAIVLDDADLESNLESFFAATMQNNGQICHLGTRILAPRSRYAEVLDTVTGMVSSLTVGDSLDPRTQVGPLVSAQHRARVEGYIAKGVSDGGRLTTGGRRADRDKGWFVEPTVFGDVDNRQTIAREEIFGPVVVVIPYRDDDEAVAIANDSEYGLGGQVWTSDPERGLQIARRVVTGTIGINRHAIDYNIPFGGVKASGLGREFGTEGLASYQYLKAIHLGLE
jgi:aldehyde dehydrogenase (NAD+)